MRLQYYMYTSTWRQPFYVARRRKTGFKCPLQGYSVGIYGYGYWGGGVGGPNKPELTGGGGAGRGVPGIACLGTGESRAFGLHCAHAGSSGFGGGGGRGGGAGELFVNALPFPMRSGRLWTTRQAGLAGRGGPRSSGGPGIGSGGGGGPAGPQPSAYSPSDPCLDLTLISSAISYCN